MSLPGERFQVCWPRARTAPPSHELRVTAWGRFRRSDSESEPEGIITEESGPSLHSSCAGTRKTGPADRASLALDADGHWSPEPERLGPAATELHDSNRSLLVLVYRR